MAVAVPVSVAVVYPCKYSKNTVPVAVPVPVAAAVEAAALAPAAASAPAAAAVIGSYYCVV